MENEMTEPTYSQVLEREIEEWKKFRRALRKEDQQVFDQLFEKARLHIKAGGSASRPWPFETILISVLLEQEKALVELRSKIEGYKKQEEQSQVQLRMRGLSPGI